MELRRGASLPGTVTSPWKLIFWKDFLRLGMEESHKEHREGGEEMMKYLSDLHLTQIVFKSHSA